MALIDDVKQICDRLAPLGWGALLQWHGLNIAAADLGGELEPARDRRISRLSRRCDPRSRTGGSGAQSASNVFQPGWDISLGQDRGTFHTAVVWATRGDIEDQAASDLRVTPSMTC